LPRTEFLFWNINPKPPADVVADLADTHRADVVMLAESRTEPELCYGTLNLF
jgi:hypothetical protein